MSKDYFNPPLKQLFELAPGTLDHSIQVNYESFINEGGTVFQMLKMGRQGVVDAFGLHSRQAQVLLDKAMSLAVYTAREFREQRLVRPGPANPLHRTGIRALVKTPPSMTCSTLTGKMPAPHIARIRAFPRRRISCGW